MAHLHNENGTAQGADSGVVNWSVNTQWALNVKNTKPGRITPVAIPAASS
jgi:hypothetical protein